MGMVVGDTGKMTIPGVDFWMKDGRIYYDNFEIIWNGVTHLKFRGSVGLDDSMELWVGIPIPPDLLNNGLKLIKIPGTALDAGKLASMTQDKYIEIPITGSRSLPHVKVEDVGSLLQNALGGLLGDIGKAPGAVGGGVKSTLDDIFKVLPLPGK